MKKSLLLLLLVATTGILRAYDFQVDSLCYNILTDQSNAVEVTYELYFNQSNYSNLRNIVIPDTITYQDTTYSVASIGKYAFRWSNNLTSVTIPNSVTSIGNSAFESCNLLISVTIGNSVTSIGECAFKSCRSLLSVTIPNSVTSIKNETFRECSGMTSVTIGNSVTSIGNYAFYYCTGLTSVTIPDSVTSIGSQAFSSCTNLISVIFGNSVTSIGDEAFYDCKGLTSVTIGNSVTSIGNYAFGYCSSLTSVSIPNRVTEIGDGVFASCKSLKSISVATGNPMYDSRDNCSAIIETATNTLIVGCQGTTIPNSVTSIGSQAFRNCINLLGVTIPDSVSSIGNSAFYGCSGLSSFTCEATTPPALGSNVFSNVVKSIPLYVPGNSIAIYQSADQWQDFTNIQAISEKIYIDSAICESDLPITWHDKSIPYIGTYYDTLQAVEGYDSVIFVLNLTAYPTYLFEENVTVRENNLPYQWQGRSLTEAGNYVAEYETIHGCDSIYTLQLTIKPLVYCNVTIEADHGYVEGTGTYPEGMQITLTAVPDEGFEFQMWSDGTTANPKEFIITRDTTLRAHFYMPAVEQEVTVGSIEPHSVTLVWDTVPGAVLYELRIYKNGHLVVTYEIDANNTILNETFHGPDRLIARRDSTGGSSETLQVDISGLESGQDYTYSLDALDDNRNFVGAQSGSFTTGEEPIDGLDTLFDDRRTAPRKVLHDGQLYIEMPDGSRYDARGCLVE